MPFKDKENQKKASAKHYLLNKEACKKRVFENNKKIIERNRSFVNEYLSNHPCVDCSEADIIVLEFDHVSGKKLRNVCDLIRRGCSLKTITAEIKKCEVRCANCHRRVTHKRRLD